ncbi:precorrin-3B C(17)-methyltransferase [Rhizobium halophytocola]|uniref:Precorrin-3B C17-methyltransferase n=1 Tax=Rhizobium halophytocola TaxID=735519 RepID=A0ABS4DZJ8_9HYPH|nr:precorrin-3B C(17)-methyltransferase [Rhizobium halophytocola]MBP1851110.1 precorrin-3B C17-methyltransferase [Rhizobium halophytocola]
MTSLSHPAVIILSEPTLDLGRRIAALTGGEVHGAAGRTRGASVLFDDLRQHVGALFGEGRPIIAVMASGALIRLLAPLLSDKTSDPPVVAVSEDGASVVPLLGGHHGANDLARAIAAGLQAHAAITTAGDLKFGVALDQPPQGLVLANPADAKGVMAELVAGGSARLDVVNLTNDGAEPVARPFWPAGHLPLKGGDQLGATAPASAVLADPAAASGETPAQGDGIPGTFEAVSTAAQHQVANSKIGQLAGHESISPLEGEMPGRAEGGMSPDNHNIADWLTRSRIPFADDAAVTLTITDRAKSPAHLELVYHPKTLVLGMGCERHASSEEAIALAESALADSGHARQSLAAVCSIDLKADEAAVHAVAAHFGVPARFFDAATLEAEAPRLVNPSDIVFAEVGCHGVAEGAALAAAGPGGTLVVEKIKSKGVTAAIARSNMLLDPSRFGRSRGRLYVVGIGPGSEAWRSPEVSRMVAASTDLVGYSLYLDLLGDLTTGKTRHDFDLGKEEARVVHAMELAGEGRDVALVCSGDAGIYAMATLVFELFDKGGISDAASRIAVQCSPGISALQGAAARIGAPLGHDFCTISLSDLLTPWEHIQKRVRAAGEGDFVIAFYNPVSMKRRTQLAWARDELMKYRPASSPVVLATNLGRAGENVRTVPLGELDVDDVDMLTVVVVGSSESRTVKTGDGKTWVYTPRGYSGKADTAMTGAAE